jgi:alcohol dehydrogenase (cytochrome c)
MTRFVLVAALIFAAVAAWPLAAQQTAPTQATTQPRPFTPVTDEMLFRPPASEWLSWRRTLDSHGFSPLNQINRNNVGQLKMMWGRPMGQGNQEATPLAYEGVLYVPNSGDYIMAIDVKTGDLLWETRRKLTGRGATNRNMAIWGTTLIDGSSDNFMYAIDARTGQPAWETPILDPR